MQKKMIYIVLGIFTTLLILSSINISQGAIYNSTFNQQNNQENKALTLFNIKTPLPEVPQKIMIYNTVDPDITTQDIHKYMDLFKLQGDINNRQRNIIVQEGEKELEVFIQPGTGYLRYSYYEKFESGKEAKNLPLESEAIKMAESFWENSGLLPENTFLIGIGYCEFERTNAFGNLISKGKTAISVKYGFTIDGIPAIGAGAKAGVVFGDNGELVMVYKFWREIEPDRKVDIITPEEALDNFKLQCSLMAQKNENLKDKNLQIDIVVNEIYLAYQTEPGCEPQTRIEPIYVFSGNAHVNSYEGEQTNEDCAECSNNFQIFIPAISE